MDPLEQYRFDPDSTEWDKSMDQALGHMTNLRVPNRAKVEVHCEIASAIQQTKEDLREEWYHRVRQRSTN